MRRIPITSPHVDDDFLLDLANGLIADDVSETRVLHLRECPSCDDRFREQVRLRERVRAAGVPSSSMSSPTPEAGEARAARWSGTWRAATLAATLAAAAVLVLVVLVPFFRKSATPDVPDYWLPLDRGEVSLRSSSPSDPVSELRLALQTYAGGDAAGALDRLDRANVPESYRSLRDLFRASSLLLLGRSAQARETLEQMPIWGMPEPWRDRANWLLYTALTRTGEPDKARTILVSLVGVPGDVGDLARAEQAKK